MRVRHGLLVVVVGSLVAGCAGDPLLGSWDTPDTAGGGVDTVTFHGDGSVDFAVTGDVPATAATLAGCHFVRTFTRVATFVESSSGSTNTIAFTPTSPLPSGTQVLTGCAMSANDGSTTVAADPNNAFNTTGTYQVTGDQLVVVITGGSSTSFTRHP